jgi:uncharacterized protein (DUF1501 family)
MNSSKRSPTPPDVSRRAFLRQACCASVGATGILSALGQLRAIAAVAGDASPSRAAAIFPDYKALVCLFLQGGNDGNSLVIPADSASYAAYAKTRGDLAVAQSSLLSIAPAKYSDGRSYALHPSTPELRALFNSSRLAILGNVGTLVRPTTMADYRSGRNLPPQLFSHVDQATQWQSSIPDQIFDTGWGGRLADLVEAVNGNHQISMSISLYGTNSFQRGKTVEQMTVSSSGIGVGAYGGANANPIFHTPLFNGTKAMMATAHPNALAAAFGKATGDSISNNEVLGAAVRNAPTLQTKFPGNETGNNLAMVAKLISISQALGLRRQIFFVQLGGFDLHGAQVAGHGPLLAEISAAMKAFYDATVELGVGNQVTTFTASDFGRSFVPNAGGTDHGWGNHHLIMGGAVQGGDIYGQMPSLTLNADDDTGRGRWIPSTSVDEYNATLATWFGVSAANLPVVLPNIGRFAKPNLGFMA